MSKTKQPNPLAAIDNILSTLADDETRRPGEFTAREFFDRAREGGSQITFNSCRWRLSALADAGKLMARHSRLNGRKVVFYSPPK
jgi:hypothetical protein